MSTKKKSGKKNENNDITDTMKIYLQHSSPGFTLPTNRADSRLAPSQWERSLQSNAVSDWLGTNLESTLYKEIHVSGIINKYLSKYTCKECECILTRWPLMRLDVPCVLTHWPLEVVVKYHKYNFKTHHKAQWLGNFSNSQCRTRSKSSYWWVSARKT